MFNSKVILITGGTGSFGKAFLNNLFKNYKPKKVIVFSRDELKQYEIHNNLIKEISNEYKTFNHSLYNNIYPFNGFGISNSSGY